MPDPFPFEDPTHTLYSEALPPLGPPVWTERNNKPVEQFKMDFTGGPVTTFKVPADAIVANAITGQALRYNTGKAKLSYCPLALIEGAARGLAAEPARKENNPTALLGYILEDAYEWLEGNDIDGTGAHRFEAIAASLAYLAQVQKDPGHDGSIRRDARGLAIVPLALIEAASRAMVYGANKYARNNWRRGFPHTELMDCLLRHATALIEGQPHDGESGLHHIDHIAANVAFLLHMLKTDGGTDDRAIECSSTSLH